jgi:hypothetical protein
MLPAFYMFMILYLPYMIFILDDYDPLSPPPGRSADEPMEIKLSLKILTIDQIIMKVQLFFFTYYS